MTAIVRQLMVAAIMAATIMAAALASASAQTMPASIPSGGESDVANSLRSLWLASIEPPGPGQGADSLLQTSQTLSMIELGGRKKSSAATMPASSTAASQPQVVKALAGGATELSIEDLKKLQALSPESLPNAAELADGCFQAGQFATAAALYELALKQPEPADKAWLLLQRANCAAKTDAAASAALYKAMITQCPDSPWAPVAAVRLRMVEWVGQNDPNGLLRPAAGATTQPGDTK